MAIAGTEHTADDKSAGMTLQELQAFIDDCYRLDMPVTTPVKATVGFRAQLQRVGATAERNR